MPEAKRRSIWAIYVWCRRTDEIVDAPRSPSDPDMLGDLAEWQVRLERLWERGEVVDVLDLPLLDTKIRYPDLSIQPFLDMIKGMLMDIPDLGQDRYETFEDLHLYVQCERASDASARAKRAQKEARGSGAPTTDAIDRASKRAERAGERANDRRERQRPTRARTTEPTDASANNRPTRAPTTDRRERQQPTRCERQQPTDRR
jgi:hypothetical protein